MRLIDADKLIEHLNDYALMESPGDNESTGEKRLSRVVYDVIQNCIKAVDEQPTAYDVEAVVKQLEEMKKECKDSLQDYDPEYFIDRAIESAKGGGVDA